MVTPLLFLYSAARLLPSLLTSPLVPLMFYLLLYLSALHALFELSSCTSPPLSSPPLSSPPLPLLLYLYSSTSPPLFLLVYLTASTPPALPLFFHLSFSTSLLLPLFLYLSPSTSPLPPEPLLSLLVYLSPNLHPILYLSSISPLSSSTIYLALLPPLLF